MNKKYLIIYVLLFFALPVFSAFLGVDYIESIKSTAMIILYSFIPFIIVSTNSQYNISIIKGFVFGVFVLSIYSLVQFFLIRICGLLNQLIVYPFGEFTAFPKGMLYLISSKHLWRSNSFLLEPSVLGVYVATSYFLYSRYFKPKYLVKIVFIASVLATQSTVAYIAFFGAYALDTYKKEYLNNLCIHKYERLLKNRVLLFCISAIALLLFNSVFSRLYEISSEGSSGFTRFIPPLFYSLFILLNKPFGTGIGTVDVFIDKYHPYVEQYFGKHIFHVSSVDNIIASWFISYGVLACFFIIFLVKSTMTIKRSSSTALAYIYFLFYFATGTFNVGIHWILMIPYAAVVALSSTNEGSLHANTVGV